MQAMLSGVIVSAEVQEAQAARTDTATGEKYDARASSGTLYLLISERGEPLIKKIKCSPAAAIRAQDMNSFRVGEPVKLSNLLIDSSEYKLDNGRQGVTNKLVEDGESGKQRGSFSLSAPARPADQSRPQAVPNGQQPARQPVNA